MKIRLPSLLCAALAPLLLSACAQKGDFPSLAPRAVESEDAGASRPETQTPVPSDADLLARIAALRADAAAGQQAFAADAARAAPLVAHSGASGSESWVAAQQMVSQMEAARSRTATALAELDALAISRANQPTNAEDYAALLAALEDVRAIADGQKAEIDWLEAALRRP